MSNNRQGRAYSVGLVGMILGTLILGAAALTVIFGANPAFPIRVFGNADNERPPLAASAIRGEASGGIRRGTLAGFALPPEPNYDGPGGTWAPVDPELDEARRLVQIQAWDRAIGAYDQLSGKRPNDLELALERARVLSWSGRAEAAGTAMRAIADRQGADPTLKLEAAQYFWWAGRSEEADELISEARRLGAADPQADVLQEQIRASMTPTVRVARRWIDEGAGWKANLALARAYLAEELWPEAIGQYHEALSSPEVADSVYLELAATAAAADSGSLAIAALEEYHALHPQDRSALLNLARTYSWNEEPAVAIALYRDYLSEAPDVDARFELGQLLAWNGRNEEAAIELGRVAVARPTHAPTYTLLGDIARWRGEYELAIANYRYASDLSPMDVGVRTSLSQVEQEYSLARIAQMPLIFDECVVTVQSFSDNQGFSWTTTRGARVWRPSWGTVEVAVRQEMGGAEATMADIRRLGGFGVTAALRLPVWKSASINLLAGTTSYGDFGTYALAEAGLDVTDVAGANVNLTVRHQPAVTLASTMASLEAGATANVIQLTATRPFGSWAGYSRVDVEDFHSDFGGMRRFSGTLSMSRPVTSRVSVALGVSAVTADSDSPTLANGQALFWSPELYVAPTVGVTYRMPVGPRWTVAGTVTPGWAFVRERESGEQRFGSTNQPTLATGVELGYRMGDWVVGGNAQWSGAADLAGYSATTVQINGSYQVGAP